MKRILWIMASLLALAACGGAAGPAPDSQARLPTITPGSPELAALPTAPLATIPPPMTATPDAPTATLPPRPTRGSPAGALPLVVMADAVW
ncbi:MAG TPA: hypothetical protein VD886_06685 [Herpetosiphonaceae bacterium]|nr:hypothetical protein [Herpetosiphonaceae bacterium]